MRTLAAAILILLAACASSPTTTPPQPAPTDTPILSSGTKAGRGYPYGDSAMTPYLHLTAIATSPSYGYSAMAAVKVGGGLGEGSRNEQMYLRGLRGPHGEIVEYERAGSCCGFKTPSSELGGLLDIYTITWRGAEKPLRLYINMYDPGETLVPMGLTARND
jgi:hypothetical protein